MQRAELTEPFAQLLTPDCMREYDTPRTPQTHPDVSPLPQTPAGTLPPSQDAQGRRRDTPNGVTAGRTTKNPDNDLAGVG